MTLSELKEIGVEAGIDAARIEKAARSLDRGDQRPLTRSVLGAPTTVRLDRFVPVRLEGQHLPQLLDVIRDEFARQGSVVEVLGGIEWKAMDGFGTCHVSIRPQGEQTRIRVLGDYRDVMQLWTVVGGVLLAMGIAVVAASLGATGAGVILPIALGGGVLMSIGAWRYAFHRKARSADHVTLKTPSKTNSESASAKQRPMASSR